MSRRENNIDRALTREAKRNKALKEQAKNKEKRLEEEKKSKEDAEAKQQRQEKLEKCRKCLNTKKNCIKQCNGIQRKEINTLTDMDIKKLEKKLGINKLKF